MVAYTTDPFETEALIAGSREELFALLPNAEDLKRITPSALPFRIETVLVAIVLDNDRNATETDRLNVLD
jgi:hypothetical protein